MTGVTRMRWKNRKARRAPSARDDFAFDCLSRLARILVRCGHSPRDLVRQLRDICRTLDEPRRRWDPRLLSLLAELPHVIAVWHADPRYLDIEGKPLGLAWQGPRASLGALIKQVLPHENSRSVFAALTELRGIRRRRGRYFPAGRHIAYRRDTARLNTLTFLVRILRTAERNISGAKTAILERNATHPAFPVAALPGFHGRLKERAADFLWDIDTDMRRREKRFRGRRKTRVGVEIFAFEEPIRTKSRLSKRPARDGAARAVIRTRKRRRTAG